jgi:6-pyruvoyl-tetrahydropterin synthase
MNLTKTLRKTGYNLIEGPLRNHILLQLWLEKPSNEVELYYSNIEHAFLNDKQLNEVITPTLDINATIKDEYQFNIGMSLIDDIIKSLGLGTFELSSEIVSGKKVTISYDHAIIKEIPTGEIQKYLSNADFRHPNNALLKNANTNNLLVVSGVILAKNLIVEIETDFSLDIYLILKLNKSVDRKLDFSIVNTKKLKMVSTGKIFFPIAVKAERIIFDKGHFVSTNLLKDNKKLF